MMGCCAGPERARASFPDFATRASPRERRTAIGGTYGRATGTRCDKDAEAGKGRGEGGGIHSLLGLRIWPYIGT